MQKNKVNMRLNLMLDIKDGKPMPRTTEKSEFNKNAEANRPTRTYYQRGTTGRMLTQREMGIIRRNQQIWPGGAQGMQTDADRLRGFKIN